MWAIVIFITIMTIFTVLMIHHRGTKWGGHTYGHWNTLNGKKITKKEK